MDKYSLLQLLEDWVLRKHKHALAPTVNVLENVLYCPLVGLGVLASEVRMKFGPNCCKDLALPYFVANINVISKGLKVACLSPTYVWNST